MLNRKARRERKGVKEGGKKKRKGGIEWKSSRDGVREERVEKKSGRWGKRD